MARAERGAGIDLELLDSRVVDEELARRHYWDFFRLVNPDYVLGWWQRDAAERLERFLARMLAGERPALVLTAPSQHGKSMIVTDFFGWCLGRCPGMRSGFASYSDYLGTRANLRLQRLIDSETYRRVFPATRLCDENVVTQAGKPRRNSTHLELVGQIGSFRNTTVEGPLTGEPLDLGMIDDPVKDRQTADSTIIQARVWDWFRDVFRTRFSKAYGLIVIMTRWNLADLVGHMIADDPTIDVVSYPAIAIEDEPHRKRGEALFPELKPLEFLLEQKAAMDPASWESIYQQNPVPREGAMIKRAWLSNRYTSRGADPIRIIQSWDCASKAKESSANQACITIAEFPDRLEVWDVFAQRLEIPDLLPKVRELAEHWNPSALLIEDRDSGQGIIQYLRRGSRLPVIAIDPGQRDKVTRLEVETPLIQAGKLWLPESAPWVADFVAEVTTFPGSPRKDRVDALSQVLRWIRERSVSGSAVAPPLSITRPAPVP